jgi:hypothetical protein
MFPTPRGGIAAAVALLLSGAVQAQSQAPSPAPPQASAPRPDPLDPRAIVPTPGYASPLARYRSALDVKPGDWKAANETVNRIGGWRTYAREQAPPDPAPGAPNASTGAAPAPGSDAHRHHGGALR